MKTWGLTEAEWAALPFMERARKLVFVGLETEVQTYHEYKDALTKHDVDLEDWLNMDAEAQKMRLDFATRNP